MRASNGFATCDRRHVYCAHCRNPLGRPDEPFVSDVCPACRHFALPTRLDIYENLELLQRGGMGAVYRAEHAQLGTVVAIKLVHTPGAPDTIVERFDREARLAARIPHPGVVRVIDHDAREGRLYLVMEYVDGSTLRERLAQGLPPVPWSLDVMAQLADVLHAAHEQGIVHRDVKPENVMVDRSGRVRVLDFGISRAREDKEHLTRTGEILGTPEYIAPEQILDVPEAVDRRTDIHALGAVLFELLTGKSPFAGQNLFQVLKYVESLTPPPPSTLRHEIPVELDALVLSALAKDREGRPPDAACVASRLREIAAREIQEAKAPPGYRPAGQRTPGILRTIGLLAAVLGLGAGLGWLVALNLGAGRSTVPAGPRPAAVAPAVPAGAALHDQGLKLLQDGAFLRALELFRQAEQAGHEPSGRAARRAWICLNRLYPLLLNGPDWLAERHDGFPQGNGTLDRGLKALAENDWAAAEALFEQHDPGETEEVKQDRALLVALCRRWQKKPATFDPGDSPDAAGLLLTAVLVPPEERIARIERVRDRLDRLSPMRYFLEMALATAEERCPAPGGGQRGGPARAGPPRPGPAPQAARCRGGYILGGAGVASRRIRRPPFTSGLLDESRSNPITRTHPPASGRSPRTRGRWDRTRLRPRRPGTPRLPVRGPAARLRGTRDRNTGASCRTRESASSRRSCTCRARLFPLRTETC